jgi:hypothetical protein
MVLAEIGDASSPNTVRQTEINTLLSNKQKWLASEYSWPFLEQFWDSAVGAGAQYVQFPTLNDSGLGETTAINFERPVLVQVFWNQIYLDMDYGIGSEEYNYLNPQLQQFCDPIQRWRFRTDTSEPTAPDTYEVWPVPVTPQTVRFTGQRTIIPLTQDTDKADLDDMLLVYFVAAEMLMRSKQEDAQLKMSMAKQRLEKLRGAYPVRTQEIVLGRSNENVREQRRIVPLIIVAHG